MTAKLKQSERQFAIRTPFDRLISRIAVIFGRSKAKELERFMKFAVVGTIGAVVDIGIFNLLLATILPPTVVRTNVVIAGTVSFIAAVVSNFIWNRYWTYPDSRSRALRKQLGQFFIVSVSGWTARSLWIYFSTPIFIDIADTFEVQFMEHERLGATMALFVAIFVVMIWNFFVNRYWTYNDVE